MIRLAPLVLCLAACGGADPTAASSCPYARAPGVVDVSMSGGSCVYACAQPDAGAFVEFCGGACVPIDTTANCGACGVTCTGSSPRCYAGPGRATPYCTGP